ncbi:MAG: (d)CMP kinase [Chloroflexota bacterium]
MIETTVVAIDGPAAAGKTVVGRALAAHFGWSFFDTGVLYRALTWRALGSEVSLNDGFALARLAQSINIQVVPTEDPQARPYDVFVDGQDVSVEIRSPEVDSAVAHVSAHAQVRTALIDAQRALRRPPGIVVAGRDIGTVIFPDALVKIYLDASPEVRAQRRVSERGPSSARDAEQELKDVQSRDHRDQSRDVAPLRPAVDATVLDTDHLTVDDVVRRAIELIASALGCQTPVRPESGGR